MIDLANYRQCSGISRPDLVKRIKDLCDEIWRLRQEMAEDAVLNMRLLRDQVFLTENVSAVQRRCTELLEEVRNMKRGVP